MDDIIQLKITLKNSKPPIWRRIQVDKATSFLELHYYIQIVMGWEDSHLYEFKINNYRIGIPEEEDDCDGYYSRNKVLYSSSVTLENIIIEINEKFSYNYDFGDGWNHEIVVEKFLPRSPGKNYPVCIGGRMNCPPEDCGGIPGFYQLLEILGNKKHPERKFMLQWLGGPYDPEAFNKDEKNKYLKGFSDTFRAYFEDEM